MTFIRFVNQVTKTIYKYIGFEITDIKTIIFKIMLQSITDFTIAQSKCNLFYKNSEGEILSKSYFKKVNTPYFVNGDVFNGETQKNNIFK